MTTFLKATLLLLFICLTACAPHPQPSFNPLHADDQALLSIELNYADTGTLAKIIEDTFSVKVLCVPRINALLIYGASAPINAAQALAKNLDKETEGIDTITFIYPLKYATAKGVASVLQQAIDNNLFYSDTWPQGTHAAVLPIPHTNSLFIKVDNQWEDQLKDLLKTIDRPLPSNPELPSSPK